MIKLIFTLIAFLFSAFSFSLNLDEKLKLVIDAYDLQAGRCEANLQLVEPELSKVGKELFEAKELSGNNDTSCSTCHIEDKHLTDGLSISVGVGGAGEGPSRMEDGKGIIVPRNSFTLVGRAHKDYTAFFWDGKVEQGKKLVASPFGEHIDKNFKSPLSVAAVLPLLARDEFLGIVKFFSDNEHIDKINFQYHHKRYEAASLLLRKKIHNSEHGRLKKIQQMFSDAGVDTSALQLSDIGNAIASFIAQEKSCLDNNWNQYVAGELNALTESQKRGAILFYGKARCSACHSGNLFSDFQYHSIGVPQGRFGPHQLSNDEGRSAVTDLFADRFKFRTPPLLDVSNTPPYGHNGVFSSMNEIVEYHLNPVPFLTRYQWTSESEMFTFGKILGQRDQILTTHDIISNKEVNNIVEFLKSL